MPNPYRAEFRAHVGGVAWSARPRRLRSSRTSGSREALPQACLKNSDVQESNKSGVRLAEAVETRAEETRPDLRAGERNPRPGGRPLGKKLRPNLKYPLVLDLAVDGISVHADPPGARPTQALNWWRREPVVSPIGRRPTRSTPPSTSMTRTGLRLSLHRPRADGCRPSAPLGVKCRPCPLKRDPGTSLPRRRASSRPVLCCAIEDVYSNRIADYSLSDRRTAALAVSGTALRRCTATPGRHHRHPLGHPVSVSIQVLRPRAQAKRAHPDRRVGSRAEGDAAVDPFLLREEWLLPVQPGKTGGHLRIAMANRIERTLAPQESQTCPRMLHLGRV
jgi:hypothetical protein